MYVKKLNIENFRGIRTMELELHPRMNVFIGINGAGKSSALDALGYLLTPFVLFLFSGDSVTDSDDFPSFEIHNNENNSYLWFSFAKENQEDLTYATFSFRSRFRPARSDLPSISNPAHWKPFFENKENSNSPIIVYYRVRRVVDEVSVAAWSDRNFQKEDAFIDALAPKVDFKEFFEWFRNREDLENEERAGGKNEPDRLLESVRNVIGAFLGTVTDIRIRRRDPLRMVVTKNNRELRIEQLSDGEKCLLAMVGDLARRMAIANPSLENPLHGEGVVLIDEVDLHLHPQWQRMILPKLMETFPQCQFIVSTHSPQIIGELKSEYIIRLEETESGIEAIPANGETFGMTSNMVLQTQMDSTERNREIQDMLEEAFRAVEYGNLERAKEIKTDLEKKAKDIPELLRLAMRISLKETTGK